MPSLASKLAAKPVPVATPPHLVIVARAGTGKTTTLVEGLKFLRGQTPSIIPSTQQAEIWNAMMLSKDARTIAFVAFNKSIATELQQRVPAGVDASTMHSMGMKAVNRAFGTVRLKVDEYRTQNLIEAITGKDIRGLRRDKPTLVSATCRLVSLCKMNLIDGRDAEALVQLAGHYDVDMNHSTSEIVALVPEVLERAKDPSADLCMDFDDMIWLPVVKDLPVFKYDLLLVDEAQDLNRCQQALAKKAGKRIILCGDPKQAIYGFTGADADSMPRMIKELSGGCLSCGRVGGEPGNPCLKCGGQPTGGDQRCQVLPLTVTRRCGRAIVAEANRYVKDFAAHESNPEGEVFTNGIYKSDTPAKWYGSKVQDGDMILCRVTAPLVSQCFKFIKLGRKANIQGRNIGQGLITTIEKLRKDRSGYAIDNLLEDLSIWYSEETMKEQKKKNPSEARLIAIQDRYDCLVSLTEDLSSVDAVIGRIQSIFTDDKSTTGIRLSSIHKAKGLEARNVFILQPEGASMPHPLAKTSWQIEQEYNLLYVAITRAIETLTYVY